MAEIDPLSAPMLLGLGLAGIIAAVDGVIGPSIALIGLLAVPPLVTAIRAGPIEAGVVALVSLALAIVAGLWDEMFLEADHISRIVAVLAVGVAAVWIADLRERLQFAKEESDLLAETGTLLEDTLDTDSALQHVAALAVPALADAATIELYGEDGRIHRAATAASDARVREALEDAAQSGPLDVGSGHPISRAIRDGKTQHLPRVSSEDLLSMADAGRDLESLQRAQFRTAVFVPLRAHGKTLGALALGRNEPGAEYDRKAIMLAESLAGRAALTIENASLHAGQTYIARTLQRNLLPPGLPKVPGAEVSAEFRAAGDLNEVGGDFYDLFEAGSGDWMAVVGDVCGKGAEAAAVTAQARHTIRVAAGHVMRPSLILAQLSAELLAQRSDLRFCTAALVRIAPVRDALDLTISSGGHPPPLALRNSGQVETLAKPDLLVGAVSDNVRRRHDQSARLHKGDALVLYTDGLLDSRDRGKVDEQRAERALSGCAGLDADAIAKRLVSVALKQQGEELRDDIAVLVLRFTGAAS